MLITRDTEPQNYEDIEVAHGMIPGLSVILRLGGESKS
jgi:hypothetical protein